MSDEEYRQEGINMQLKPIKDKLDSLEKKVESINETIDNRDIIPKGWAKSIDGYSKLKEQIAELQNTFKMIDLCLKVDGKEIKLIEEVLRELIKKHKIKPTPGYTIMDPKIKEFNIELDKLLEKLDSETLKEIKKLAQEESVFYDKHGYFSFWSDKEKAQRIKEKTVKPRTSEERMKYASKCKYFVGHYDCTKPDDFFKFNENGVRTCLLAGQYPVSCYEPKTGMMHKDWKRQDYHDPKDLELKTKPPELDKDPCGIEGKYEHWTREELENECNVLRENIDAISYLHKREKSPEPKPSMVCGDGPEPKTEPERELYELFKNGDEFDFKRTTFPFTEYNNMVHRGFGQKLMDYDTEERVRGATRKELIESVLSKKILIPFIAKIIEKETNEEYCSSEIIAELIRDKLKEKWEDSLK